MTAHDLAILAEHFESSAHSNSAGYWPDCAAVDIAEYVDKAFDGAIVDDLPRLTYTDNPNDAALERRQAVTTIQRALVARYGRPINGRDLALISMAVVSEYERRADWKRNG